jgi:hypothetical protein
MISKARTPDRSTTGRALAFVQQAIRAVGPYKDQIPGWRTMGITASEWQRDFEPLKAADLVEKGEKDNDSYFLKESGPYSCLSELEQALRENRLILQPPPLPVAGD